jgi:predicted nucleic acid-binding protein
VIVDSNIVIAMLDPEAPVELNERIADLREGSALRINEIVFSELATGYDTIEEQNAMVAHLDLQIERLPLDACHRAGTAFAEYRRRGGSKVRMLPDFLIGAHAACTSGILVTRDRRTFASYFPELTVIDPTEPIA